MTEHIEGYYKCLTCRLGWDEESDWFLHAKSNPKCECLTRDGVFSINQGRATISRMGFDGM